LSDVPIRNSPPPILVRFRSAIAKDRYIESPPKPKMQFIFIPNPITNRNPNPNRRTVQIIVPFQTSHVNCPRKQTSLFLTEVLCLSEHFHGTLQYDWRWNRHFMRSIKLSFTYLLKLMALASKTTDLGLEPMPAIKYQHYSYGSLIPWRDVCWSISWTSFSAPHPAHLKRSSHHQHLEHYTTVYIHVCSCSCTAEHYFISDVLVCWGISFGDSSLVRRARKGTIRVRVRECDRIRKKSSLNWIFGFGWPWLWWPLWKIIYKNTASNSLNVV